MRRGAISKRQSRRQGEIAGAIEAQGLPAALARRIAFQLVFKFDVAELADQVVWRAIGEQLEREMARLRGHVGLADRQIIAVLPKLSADQVEDFLEKLLAADRRIARTILNAALQAADPLSAGRRYLAEYRAVAEDLEAIDPAIARTLANASFTAKTPRRKAMEHFKQFATLMMKFEDGGKVMRLPAKAAFRTPDPAKAAEEFVGDYASVLAALASQGVEKPLAKTLASSSRFRRHFLQAEATETITEPGGQIALTSSEREELARLRKEITELRMEVAR